MSLNYTLSRLLTILTFALIGSFGILSAAPGCTDPDASNYDPLADEDDGSCLYLCDAADQLTVTTNTAFDDGSGNSFGSASEMGLLAGGNNVFGGHLWNVTTAGLTISEFCISIDYTVTGDPADFPRILEFRIENNGTSDWHHFNTEVPGPGTYTLGGIVSTGTPSGAGFNPDGAAPSLVAAIAFFPGDATTLVGDVIVEFSNLCVTTDCGGGALGCTDPGANNYNPDATTDDGSCLYDVTFNVDMNCFDGNDPDIEFEGDGTFTTPAVEGPGFGWCGSCVPMEDPDLDGIWSVTVELGAGLFEYKYAHDSWTGQEQLVDDMAGGADCAPVTDFASYANRQVLVGPGAETNDVYGSCEACDSGPVNATCDGAIAINEGIFTDMIVDGTGGGSNLCFGSLGDDAVWYEYTATMTGLATVSSSIDLDQPDTRLSIHTGTCADPTCLVSDDDGGEGFTSIVTFPVNEGEAFLIEWDDRWGTDEFDFEISVVEVPDECPAPNAIICDNADDYELGPMNGQGTHWSTWSGTLGGAEDGIVTDEQAFSNSQSVLIAEGQTQDVVLLLGNQTTGTWDISWMEYIPADATAYYNLQEDETPGVAWNLDVFFNQGGTDPGNGIVTTTGNTFNYPEDEWFPVSMSLDLDNDLISVSINGVDVEVDAAYTGSLGSVNFFSIDATNRYYLDDVVFDGDDGTANDPCPQPDAIICDNVDDYVLGPINGQGAHWSTWSGTLGGAEDGIVTTEQAFSNDQSVLIAEGQTQDIILLLGNQTAGTFDISWMEYIPADATAYYNLQEDETPGVAWNLDVFFNQGGTDPGNGVVTTTGSTFAYPEDEWFPVAMSLDLDNDLITVNINGVDVDVDAPYTGSLGSVNFFSIDATNRYYLDDVIYDGEGVEPCPAPDAVICDNLDDYELGPTNGQGAHWSTWGGTLGGADDGIITDEEAFSNSQSVLIAEGQTQDVILLLGNQTTGVWDISWMEYIPADATAYYNIQEDEVPGVAWNLDVFFNQGGTDPGNGVVTTTGSAFTYPEDEWFSVEMHVDLNNDVISVTIDGVAVDVEAPFTGNIGSINFFSIDATNRYYLDDVVFDGDAEVGLIEYTESAFTVYPNPTEDMLTISGDEQIDAVVLRDVLGSVVRQLNTPFSNQVTLDVADLTSGVYFVEVRVGDVVNVSRVIKR